MKIIQVTVGEYPNLKSVPGSQVLANAIALKKLGHDVTWIAAIPWTSLMIEKLTGMDSVRQASLACAEAGIRFQVFGTAISLMRPHSFFVRNIELSRLAKKIVPDIAGANEVTILNCRSYYAADLAIRLRRMCQPTPAVVSFDMRSTFPEEMPLTMKKLGKLMYAFAKEWECQLLKSADAAFLPVNYSRKLILEETGIPVHYAPLAGFDRKERASIVPFDDKWQKPRIAYVGSVGVWNDKSRIAQMFDCFPEWEKCVVSMNAGGTSPDIKHFSLDYREMPEFYSGIVALVIPVDGTKESYFWKRKYRLNFFSTKAAEALSMGVPLIVDSKLFELADFVRQHKCGLVYDADSGRFDDDTQHSNIFDSKSLWQELTANAVAISDRFSRESVLEGYLGVWNELISRYR